MDKLFRNDVGGVALGCGKEIQVPCLNLGITSGIWGGRCVQENGLTLAFVGFQAVLPELLISNGRTGDSPACYHF